MNTTPHRASSALAGRDSIVMPRRRPGSGVAVFSVRPSFALESRFRLHSLMFRFGSLRAPFYCFRVERTVRGRWGELVVRAPWVVEGAAADASSVDFAAPVAQTLVYNVGYPSLCACPTTAASPVFHTEHSPPPPTHLPLLTTPIDHPLQHPRHVFAAGFHPSPCSL